MVAESRPSIRETGVIREVSGRSIGPGGQTMIHEAQTVAPSKQLSFGGSFPGEASVGSQYIQDGSGGAMEIASGAAGQGQSGTMVRRGFTAEQGGSDMLQTSGGLEMVSESSGPDGQRMSSVVRTYQSGTKR